MRDIRICRICLSSGVKMYSHNRHYLKQYYEEVTASKVNKEDRLPHHFCYECATMLHKFHKFKEKCCSAHRSLREMLSKGPITVKSCTRVARINKFKSSIDILTVSKNVRTYLVKSKTLANASDIESNIDEIPDIRLSENIDTLNTSHNDIIDDKPERINEYIKAERQNIIEVMLNDSEELDMKVENVNEIVQTDRNIENENEMFTDFNDKIDSDNEKSESDIEKSNLENIVEVETEQTVSDNDVESDEGKKSKTKKKISKQSKATKEKQFERRKKVNFDPKHWLKVNLSEEEALEEFKARSHDCKYLGAAYKCTSCYKGFSREDMLTRHMKLRHNESNGPVICRFCDMKFKRPGLLTRHIAQHYVRYKCLRCDLVFDLKNAALFHNDYHNGVIRKCVHCGEEFRHQSTYYTHLRSHRSEHVCTLCGESYVNETGLARHRRNMHVDVVAGPKDEVNTYCAKCDVNFETRKAYEQHLFHSAKHGDSSETTGDLNTTPTPAPYKLNSGKLTLKSFTRKPRKPTPCNICDKNFSSYIAYMRHHSLVHKGAPTVPKDPGRTPGGKEERYICEICGISLARCSVPMHLNTHTREIRYTCSTCGREFNSKTVLKQHQLTHTSEKPVPCPLCDKRFKQSSSMKLHYRTFHLKEPYPKRNRNKKNEELLKLDEFGQESDENMTLDRWR